MSWQGDRPLVAFTVENQCRRAHQGVSTLPAAAERGTDEVRGTDAEMFDARATGNYGIELTGLGAIFR